MRIECPTCEIGIDVSGDQVGQKGRCSKCETKFIIPADPSDDIEVLAEGKIPKADDVIDEGDLDVAGGTGKTIGLLVIGLIIGLVLGFLLSRMLATGCDRGGGTEPAVSGDSSDPFGLNK